MGSRVIRAGALAASGIACGFPAFAAKWDISPSASVSESYTDNVGLRPDSQDPSPDFVTSLNPSLSVRGTGGRASLNADYSLQRLQFWHQTKQNDFVHHLNGAGTAELWDKSLFLDGQAQIGQQVVNPLQPISQSDANANVNRASTRSWSLGPRFLHHFGTWAETTSTLTRQQVTTPSSTGGGTAATTTATGSPIIRNSTIDRTHFVINSGRQFTRLLWSFTADRTKTSRDVLPHNIDQLGRADLTYVVNREIALLGGLGWQKIEDDSLTEPPNGPIWSVGTQIKPGPRTTLRVDFNHQFDSHFLTYSGSYLVSPRTSLSFSHTELVQTNAQRFTNNLAFITTNAQGQIVDLRTGLPFDPSTNPAGLEDDTTRDKQWNATFTSSSGRNNYSLQLFKSEQTVERTGQTIDQIGAVASFGRQLTHVLRGSTSVSYRMTDNTGGGGTTTTSGNSDNKNLLVSGTLAYTLTPTTELDFNVNMSRQMTGDATRDTSENAASIVLRKSF